MEYKLKIRLKKSEINLDRIRGVIPNKYGIKCGPYSSVCACCRTMNRKDTKRFIKHLNRVSIKRDTTSQYFEFLIDSLAWMEDSQAASK